MVCERCGKRVNNSDGVSYISKENLELGIEEPVNLCATCFRKIRSQRREERKEHRWDFKW